MTTSDRDRSSCTLMKRKMSGCPKQECACSTPASFFKDCKTSFVRPALTLMSMYALVAITSLLSIEAFSPRHASPVLGKDPMNVAALLLKPIASLGVELAQPFEICRSHVCPRERFHQPRSFLW